MVTRSAAEGTRPDVVRREVPRHLADDFALDYGDCFVTTSPPDVTARRWATASLRGAAASGGAFARLVWHGLLGFELAPFDAPGTLVGWAVHLDTPSRFELGADGRLMAGRMVFEVDDREVAWITMLRFRRTTGRVVWSGAGHAHRALAPRSLHGAAHALR
jgi:hypothetical protein